MRVYNAALPAMTTSAGCVALNVGSRMRAVSSDINADAAAASVMHNEMLADCNLLSNGLRNDNGCAPNTNN